MEGEREDKGKFSEARNGSPVGRDCVNNTDPRALANVGWCVAQPAPGPP